MKARSSNRTWSSSAITTPPTIWYAKAETSNGASCRERSPGISRGGCCSTARRPSCVGTDRARGHRQDDDLDGYSISQHTIDKTHASEVESDEAIFFGPNC